MNYIGISNQPNIHANHTRYKRTGDYQPQTNNKVKMAFIDNAVVFSQEVIDIVDNIAAQYSVSLCDVTVTMVLQHKADQDLSNEITSEVFSYLYDVHEKIAVYGNDHQTRQKGYADMTQFDNAINAIDDVDTIMRIPPGFESETDDWSVPEHPSWSVFAET